MKSRKVHMVTADADYDGADVLRAFTTDAAAKAFAEKCRSYSDTRPTPPNVIEDSPENDRAWDEYNARQRRWEARHPAGEDYAHHDHFSVSPLKLYGGFE
ncbi:hypothetical protein [Cupriavidus sp. OTU4054]